MIGTADELEDPSGLIDPLDRASHEESVSLQEALRAHKARGNADMPSAAADGICVDGCGEEVEPARRALDLGRCLSCAQDRESRQAHRRRTMGF